MATHREPLGVQHFTDYRTFLVAHVQQMKDAKRGWSYGAWAKALGLKTTSSITKIVQGQRDPGPEVTEKLIRYFRFKKDEAEYFADLVRLHKVKDDPRLSVLLMEKMSKDHPNGSIRILDDKTFSIVSNWYYLPLRELVRTPKFMENSDWISKQFRFKVTPREITQALKAMESLGLLKRDAHGKLCVAEGRIDTSTDVASEAIKRYHEQMLENARAAIRTTVVDRREMTGASLVLRCSNLAQAKAMIREFRRKFAKTFEEENGDAVYQIQIQLFPLTKEETIQ